MNNLIEISDLVKGFPIGGGILGREVARVHAVRGINLSIARGETLGLVGESGCGKSTVGQLLLKLIEPDSGAIKFDGADISRLGKKEMRSFRRQVQIVFQDPYASLNPRMIAGDIIAEPLVIHKMGSRAERREKTMELLKLVGMPEESFSKYPHEFSGGQRQRIGIARAIALTPRFIVADEPVSALDISIRGEILNLLCDLRERFNLTYLFIAHDLKVVEHISHRIAVMYLGKIMEIFPAAGLNEAKHPYTQALVSAIPIPNPDAHKTRIVLTGDVPTPIAPPSGCPFHPRCRHAKPVCREKEPAILEYANGFSAACHLIKTG